MSNPGNDVLIVEDEVVVQSAAKRILGSEGFGVDLADDAESAMEQLKQKHYRTLVTDLMLPKASGFDLLDYARAEHPDLPVVLITGYATLEVAVEAFSKGVFDLVPKPFDAEELLGVMSRAMIYAGRATAQGGAEDIGGPPSPGHREQRHGLGKHSFAELRFDGTAVIGVGETFPDLFQDVTSAALPSLGTEVHQGDCLVRMVNRDDFVYRIWSPLSGRIVERNEQLPELLMREGSVPRQDAWLVRLLPSDLDREFSVLTRQRRSRGFDAPAE